MARTRATATTSSSTLLTLSNKAKPAATNGKRRADTTGENGRSKKPKTAGNAVVQMARSSACGKKKGAIVQSSPS